MCLSICIYGFNIKLYPHVEGAHCIKSHYVKSHVYGAHCVKSHYVKSHAIDMNHCRLQDSLMESWILPDIEQKPVIFIKSEI